MMAFVVLFTVSMISFATRHPGVGCASLAMAIVVALVQI